MIIHNLIQGSDKWAQFRLDHFGASEAAAMLGLSKKVTRSELLRMKHTGVAKDYSDWVQANILDYGHEVESLARPIIERRLGDDFYAVTCSEGPLSASCDGLTMCEDTGWEHKQWNAKLAAAVAAKELPDEFMAQPQQCLMITKAERWIFTVSDGTETNMVSMEIRPDAEWFERLRNGWDQFAKDLASYQQIDIAEKPIANSIMALPTLSVQIRGEVMVSNLPEFKVAAHNFVTNIKTDLRTDEDFADAEAIVKFCDQAEKDLELAKKSALSQTASIDELLRTIDFIKNELRTKRLMLDKLVSIKKIEIKESILKEVRAAFGTHIAGLEAEIQPIKLVFVAPDFAGAAKNRRTLASIHDAVDTMLAGAKIAADVAAKGVRDKLAWFKQNTQQHDFLFRDIQALIQKPLDDFQLAVNTRITEHKQAEADKMKAIVEKAIADNERKLLEQQQAIQAEEKRKHDAEIALVVEEMNEKKVQHEAEMVDHNKASKLARDIIEENKRKIEAVQAEQAALSVEKTYTTDMSEMVKVLDAPSSRDAAIKEIEACMMRIEFLCNENGLDKYVFLQHPIELVKKNLSAN